MAAEAHADPRARFGPVAERYHRGRPSYPAALVDWVLAQAGLPAHAEAGAAGAPRIADIGCGTGIATRLFAARGFDVVGVDPSEGMLSEARAAGGGARYVRGEAVATSLPDHGTDLVIVAQALHWFDLEPALGELARILRPGGTCAAFWNERAAGVFEDDYEPLLRRFSREYKGGGHAAPVLAALEASPRVSDLRQRRFRYHQELGREALFDRVHSSSYVAYGVADAAAFDAALGELFERHQREGRVRLDYDTPAAAWRPRR